MQILQFLSLKNIQVSGSLAEMAVRKFLKRYVPECFSVTHGHIATFSERENKIILSPQTDVIICDKGVLQVGLGAIFRGYSYPWLFEDIERKFVL